MPSGSIEPLPSGKFRAVVRAGKDPITGKYVKLTETCETEKQAQLARDRMLARVEAESHPDWSATVETLMERWCEVADHDLSTSVNVASVIRRVINPRLGEMKLRKLQHRVDILDRLYKHLSRCSVACDGTPFIDHRRIGPHSCDGQRCAPHVCRPMSPASIHRVHAILSPALGYAVSWGWIDRNPAEHAHPPALKRRRASPQDEEQVARLLNLAWSISIELGLFLWLAATTGARRGELVALRRNRVDLARAILRIEKNYVVRNGQRREKETKTDADRRLSLDPLSVQMLIDYERQRAERLAPAHLELAPDAFVFSPDPMGTRPWHPDHFSHAYRKLTDVLGIAEPLKNRRQFNATQLLAAGVDLRTTAGRLGHADGGATTLKVYADWKPAVDRRAFEQLAGDLAALRDVQAGSTLSGAVAGPDLQRLGRPIAEILQPAVDGRTTYVQVAAALRDAIMKGKLEPGDPLPALKELANWYGLVSSTAQRAVGMLAGEGLVVRPGARWIVAPTTS
jgi:integrase